MPSLTIGTNRGIPESRNCSNYRNLQANCAQSEAKLNDQSCLMAELVSGLEVVTDLLKVIANVIS